MRLLLLWAGVGMTTTALLLLVVAVVSRDVRVRRRATVVRALEVVVGGGHPGPLSGRVGRAVVLEVADRIGADSLAPVADLVRSTAADATSDLTSRRWVRRAKGLRTLMPLGLTVEELLAGLADRAPGVRAQAATAAAGRTEPEVIDALVRMLDDPAPYVRFQALDAVAHRGA
ncbi:MAG: HEAT repeat domain-containing protein, partial [Actinomycetota bacterium]|nr:HEAT repeat domain-containing protein [Actinomycetota bacterium]